MGVTRTPAPGRPRPARHSIRFTFITMVIVPVLCLVIFWGLAVALTPGGTPVRQGLFSSGHHGLAQVAVQVGAGVIMVLAAAVLMALFARRLTHEVSGLEMTARNAAEVELPRILADLRGEQAPGAADGFTPPVAGITEIAGAAAAITSLRQAAVTAATDEARLRQGVAQVFVSLARRSQSLLQRQLHLIDTLERKATDPGDLSDLFSLDHLTTRMRRHAENLIVLSGSSPGRSWSQPVPVIDVVRAAMAEVEDYQRVKVVTQNKDAVIGAAAADLIHLLAELIENATLFSPSGTEVEVRAERVPNGFVIEIEDRGLGVSPDDLSEINQKLLRPQDFSLADPDRLGLFVVSRLAARHGSRVSLSASPHGGTTAVVLLPAGILEAPAGAAAANGSGEMPAIRTRRRPARRERPSRNGFAALPRRGASPAAQRRDEGSLSAPVTGDTVRADVARGGTAIGDALNAKSASGDAQDTGTGARRGLPRRVRQANLSPHLRDRSQPAISRDERTPEEARALVAAFRAGWQRESQPPEAYPAEGQSVTQSEQRAFNRMGPDSAAAPQGEGESTWKSGAQQAPEQT